jgi:formylmethanofuran dehydrogenase subunit A
VWHSENEGSGGIVPYQYKQGSFVNGLQWAIGLEIFLLSDDPWRLFFTTDHPNGAPFTRYPELIHLLMSYDYRMACLSTLHTEIQQMTLLKDLKREYSLEEIAMMTRAAPAKLLGQTDRGHLQIGAKADIAIYHQQEDLTKMFRFADKVFKDGELIVKDGQVLTQKQTKTLSLAMGYNDDIETVIQSYMDQYYSLKLSNYGVTEDVNPHPNGFAYQSLEGVYSA